MELINQHTKAIMEGCKERARAAGLSFADETLEYIVTNRDLLELSPKVMIPTLYDYWVQDVEVLQGKGRYQLYPSNPYETVINTRPAISFYNDNNPDWLNVMIFYHVLGHIDFFQNNHCFRHTWDYDFTGQALADKRMIARLRSEKGRQVDYIIEFARGIDNLVGYHELLADYNRPPVVSREKMVDFYFDLFLQQEKDFRVHRYMRELERYNRSLQEFGAAGEQVFFAEVNKKYPEFETIFQKSLHGRKKERLDLLQFLLDRSEFLNRDDNSWMKSILEVVRNTSLFFQPQIRTKIMNEGWASYWHETLFLQDDRIGGHEVDFARVNAGVTAMPRVGLNPYALGMRLFFQVEEKANAGKFSHAFQRLTDSREREKYNLQSNAGREYIFAARENHCDATFVRNFIDQDFVDRHKLFVAGKRLNKDKMRWEYYVKSRKAEEYRAMVEESLYHPPHLSMEEQGPDGMLSLAHLFEGKPLVREYIANTLVGIEYLWGRPVRLTTSELKGKPAPGMADAAPGRGEGGGQQWQRIRYTMRGRKLSRETM